MGLFSRGNKNSEPEKKNNLFSGKTVNIKDTKDYSDYSNHQLFNQFKSIHWKNKTDDEKIAILQEIENREAEEHNRPPAKVVQIYSNKLGGYSYGTNIIEVKLVNNQFEVLDSLFHESEHANQYRAPINEVSFSENDRKLMKIEDMTSSNGKDSHYVKYEDDLYDLMTSEIDANNAAFEKVSSLKKEYINEKKFKEYLAGRKAYFNKVENESNLKSSMKKEALLDTIYGAYVRNEISEKEYQNLQQIITSDKNYDHCAERRTKINEALSHINTKDEESIKGLSLKSISENDDLREARHTINSILQTPDDFETEDVNNNTSSLNNSSEDYSGKQTFDSNQVVSQNEFDYHQIPFNDNKIEKATESQIAAKQMLTAYMFEHNYGRADYAEYSQDPFWRQLHKAAYPDSELPPLRSPNAYYDLRAKSASEVPEETNDTDKKNEIEEDTKVEETKDVEVESKEAEVEEQTEAEEVEIEEVESEEVEAEEETKAEEVETEEVESEDAEAEEETEAEEVETEEAVTEEVESEEVEAEEETEAKEVETEEVESEEVEAEEETEAEEFETEEVESEEVEAEEETEAEEVETEEVESEDAEAEEETESEEVESGEVEAEEETEVEQAETEEVESEDVEAEEETEAEEAETEEVESEEVEAEEETEEEQVETEEVESEETETEEETESEEVESGEVEAEEETEAEEVETEEVGSEESEVEEETESEEAETEEVESEEVEEETETEEIETEEVESEETKVEETESEKETEVEQAETEEVGSEEIESEEEIETEDIDFGEEEATEKIESEDIDSAMYEDDNEEYEDLNYEEDSTMLEDLDNTEDVTKMEDNSEIIDDLGENEDMDSSMSDSYDWG